MKRRLSAGLKTCVRSHFCQYGLWCFFKKNTISKSSTSWEPYCRVAQQASALFEPMSRNLLQIVIALSSTSPPLFAVSAPSLLSFPVVLVSSLPCPGPSFTCSPCSRTTLSALCCQLLCLSCSFFRRGETYRNHAGPGVAIQARVLPTPAGCFKHEQPREEHLGDRPQCRNCLQHDPGRLSMLRLK